MTFANPSLLWLLLVFPPALAAFFWWSGRRRQELMARFIQARLLPGLLSGVSPAREKIRCGLLVLGVACLIVALARPQWGFTWEEVKQRGLDIVVAVDTSKSMLAEDIAPNRLARAKLAALELMQRAKSDRLGLVAFAGSAFLQCPLTIDDAVFRQSVEALDVHTVSDGGTAIAEAIQTAMTAFKEGDNHKVLVLITDGEDHDSGAVEAAKKAAEAGLQIFTIGIGSTEGELLRIKDANGNPDYIRDEQGNVVKSHLNETLLQQLAGVSERGFYLRLQGAKVIDTLYEKGLAPLPKSEANETLTKRMHERYHWPLAVGILLFIAEMLFPERKREAKPKVPLASAAAKPALQRVAALLVLVALPVAVWGSPSSALRDYKSEQYDKALKEYEQLLKRKGDDPRLHYNAGASAYRNRQFEEADKQFEAALASPDLKLQSQAYYNRGNTRFYLGAGAPDPKLRSEMWKKALQDYQSAMKLDQQDVDARHNYDFVKKRLEELQQQPQNQQNKSNDQQDQDQQKQQQQQQQQNQQKQDQQKDQNQQQQQAQQKQSEQKDKQHNQQSQQQQSEQQKQQQQAKDQQQKQQQANQASAQPKDKSDEKDQQEGKAYAEGQMTPQQAQQLLDAQKDDEQVLPPEKPDQKPRDSNRPIRDW